MAKFIYTKLNTEPIEIEYVEDEHDSEKDFEPSFWFENSRHYLNDFMRTHNNPWCCGDFPEYIHGYDSTEYYKPLMIELIGDSAVNVYREEEQEETASDPANNPFAEVAETVSKIVEKHGILERMYEIGI